jgi:hypothetical protein
MNNLLIILAGGNTSWMSAYFDLNVKKSRELLKTIHLFDILISVITVDNLSKVLLDKQLHKLAEYYIFSIQGHLLYSFIARYNKYRFGGLDLLLN